MRHSKFKPVLESMELRLTLSDVNANMMMPPASPASGFIVPGDPVKVAREPVDMTGYVSDDWMDFSNQSVPDTITYYTDPYHT